MSQSAPVPELKQLLGSLIVASTRPLTIKDLRQCLQETAEKVGAETTSFRNVKETDITSALEQLTVELEKARSGFSLAQVAGGYRLQTNPSCGKWVRTMLEADKPNRLSKPCLETLAIIAYRQPIARSEIEGVRGVNVDYVVKTLLEMQLIRIVGRSELPGKPFLYGTTHFFLEHFGLRDLKDLSDMEPMLLRQREKKVQDAKQAQPAKPPAQPGTAVDQGMPAEQPPEDESASDKQPLEDEEDIDEDEDEFDEDDEDDEDEGNDKP